MPTWRNLLLSRLPQQFQMLPLQPPQSMSLNESIVEDALEWFGVQTRIARTLIPACQR